MTQEQILQNAEQHVKELSLHGDSRYYEMNGFVAGAHSRDEEVEQLKAELAKAKNPWVSVEERLPDDKQGVFICKSDGRMYCGKYNKSLKIFTTVDPSFIKWTINNVKAWMPIPGGGES